MYDPEMRKDCPMRGNLGNCSPVGGFCMDAVSDEICEAVHNAYEHGFYNAVRMMKEQEHSETFIVIDNKTGEEADMYNIALHEEWAQHLCYCDMEGWAIEDDGTLLLVDECGRFAYADRERFKVKWE